MGGFPVLSGDFPDSITIRVSANRKNNLLKPVNGHEMAIFGQKTKPKIPGIICLGVIASLLTTKTQKKTL